MIPADVIERVVDDFESRISLLKNYENIDYIRGGIQAYRMAINELRKVLDDYGKGNP